MGSFRVFAVNGGNLIANKTGIFDVNADEFLLFNDQMGKIGPPLIDYKLGPDNRRALAVNIANHNGKVWHVDAPSAVRMRIFGDHNPGVQIASGPGAAAGWSDVTGSLPPSPTNGQAFLADLLQSAREGRPWEIPQHGSPPDPAGPNWDTRPARAEQPDDSPTIQRLLDTSPDGIARLPAGTYYIGTPPSRCGGTTASSEREPTLPSSSPNPPST
jgi:hypothetical protein